MFCEYLHGLLLTSQLFFLTLPVLVLLLNVSLKPIMNIECTLCTYTGTEKCRNGGHQEKKMTLSEMFRSVSRWLCVMRAQYGIMNT